MVGETVGHYKILEKLGAGGMGEVYLAEDTSLQRQVALKTLRSDLASDPELLERFKREARSLAALNHPGIVTIFSVEESESIHFLTMELVEGDTLTRIISREGMPLEKLLRIAIDVANALSEAHAHGVIHRDLKPQNIMLDSGGRAKVVDFGLAKLRRPEFSTALTQVSTEAMTCGGAVLGTVPYMSPEQAQGGRVDERTDLFSLGAVIYEMATGRRPFAGDNPVSLISSILKDTPEPIREVRPELPPGLDTILNRCLEKSTVARYESAQELRQALEELQAAIESGAEVPAEPPDFLVEEVDETSSPKFVGRNAELARLDLLLEESLASRGQVVFVTGEAGTGKTALVEAFITRALESHEDLVPVLGGCNAQTGVGDPYGPIRRVVSLLSGDVKVPLAAGVLSRQQARRLWDMLPLSAEAIVRNAPDLVDIFISGEALLDRVESGLSATSWLPELRELVERKKTLPPDAMLQQSALFGQCARLLQSIARQKPLLIVIEDLHWTDAASVGLLLQLAQDLARSPVLIIGTYRPSEIALGRSDKRHPLEPVVHELQRRRGEIFIPLGQTSDRTFVEALIDSEPNQLSQGFRETLFERTRGQALFTVELLRDMQDRDMLTWHEHDGWIVSPELDWDTLPAKVEGTIGERLARLSEQHLELLRVASVEGEDFTAEVLSQVKKSDTRDTIRLLSHDLEKRHRLVTERGLRSFDATRLSLYRFRHVLFQRYLYDNLDEAERAYLHEDVGRVLEGLYGEQTEQIAPELARHFEEAGILDKAVTYLVQAGQRAVRMSAHQEGIAEFTRALELLEQLPDSADRHMAELQIQSALCSASVATMGFAAPRVGRAAERADELAMKIGDDPTRLLALWFLMSYQGVGGEYREAIRTGETMLDLATSLDDAFQAAMAHWTLGVYRMCLGELEVASTHLDQTIAFSAGVANEPIAFLYGLGPEPAARTWSALVLLLRGYPDKARAEAARARASAQELDHRYSLAFAVGLTGYWVHYEIEPGSAEPYMDRALEMSEEHGFVEAIVAGRLARGAALMHRGEVDEGRALVLRASELWQATGAKFIQGGVLARAAALEALVGRVQEGLDRVAEGLAFVEQADERLFEPELWRLRGELLLAGGEDESEVESCYQKALEISEPLGARLWQIRAATSLGQLWMDQGRHTEARRLLAPVYDWFTEGFDIPDLRKARVLLGQLTGGASQ